LGVGQRLLAILDRDLDALMGAVNSRSYYVWFEDGLPRNPLLRLIIASERASLSLEDVLEHLVVQLCLEASVHSPQTKV